MPERQNIVFILSDEHNRAVSGCYGNPIARTPNIDRLAQTGTRFDNAYCNSPICVPARAALATGRHVHDVGCWDNANPYHGQYRSWHHELRDEGYDVVSFGKLHFRSSEDDNGFSEERLPLHIVDGVGDLKGILRRPVPPKTDAHRLAAEVGAGDSGYGRYDHAVCKSACEWLEQRGASAERPPFALFVSFIRPHFPLLGPPGHYREFAHLDFATLRPRAPAGAPDHPAAAEMARFFRYDDYFADDEARAEGLRGYYAMVSDVDDAIGQLMGILGDTGLGETTTVIYTSDHGDNLGNRGLWGKSFMYEDSVTIPMVAAGPRFPAGAKCTVAVSLLDVYPTILDLAELPPAGGLPGRSLVELASADDPDRPVLSQYHAAGSPTGVFMLRRGRWKYVHYVGHRPQLFDLDEDPDETRDLATLDLHADTCRWLDEELRRLVDPEDADARAFSDQQAMIDAAGGRETILGETDIPYTPAPGES